MKVKEWITDGEDDEHEISCGGMGGFFQHGMRWHHYIDDFPENEKLYLEAIRASVVENNLRLTGENHQYGPNGVPLFSDDTVGSFSYRGWGDLMAAIWAEEEDKDYCYMDFYM